MKHKQMKLIDQIRQAVESSGKSRYQIAKETDIDEAALSRFVHGAGLSMQSLDALGECLGLSIKIDKSTKSSTRKER